jgi:hypothetical protein
MYHPWDGHDVRKLRGADVGNHYNVSEPYLYVDSNSGDVTWFQGREYIEADGNVAYELVYHGGLIH